MNKNLTLSLGLILLFSFQNLSAQVASTKKSDMVLTEQELGQIAQFGSTTKAARSYDSRYQGIKGTPYWNDGVRSAMVKFKDKEEWVEIKANLNLEDHLLMVVLKEDEDIFKVKASSVEEIKFADEPYPFVSIRNKEMAWNESSYAFASKLHSAKYHLVKVTNKVFKKADFENAYSTDQRYDEFQVKEAYWFSTTGKSFKKIKLGKKGLQNALPKRAKAIAKILKENDLNPKEENDAIKLIELLEAQLKK